jgi:hypothetical protein
MTHREQVLERALDNLVHRIERGQEYPNASEAVCCLYGVDSEELGDAYMDHCALGQPVVHVAAPARFRFKPGVLSPQLWS